jgi:hypothetical protein
LPYPESRTTANRFLANLERLASVLMTAFKAALGLLPLALSAGQPGKKLLQPIAVVIPGGLVSSTLLDQCVTPALFYRVGRTEFQVEPPPEEGSHGLAVPGREQPAPGLG